MKSIYLDYNATTPVAPTVLEAMLPFLAEHYGNPSSSHAMGRACHEAIEDARAHLAMVLGADSDEIFFTSGGTESNNLAILGTMQQLRPQGAGHVIISTIEHPAVAEPAHRLEHLGFDVSYLPCDRTGLVSPQRLEELLRPDTRLVSIMHANNEVGTIQPIPEIASVCKARDVLLHTDAAQTLGKIPTQVRDLGVDLLSIAGHKLYAPKGVGALYVRRGVALQPIMYGANHEAGLRPGTENTAFIVGLGAAAQLTAKRLDQAAERLEGLRDSLFERLLDYIPDLMLNGHPSLRLPNTLNVSFPGVSGYDLLQATPDICASTGAACHSGPSPVSPTLAGMQCSVEQAVGAVRFSLGWGTSEDEITKAADLIAQAWLVLGS